MIESRNRLDARRRAPEAHRRWLLVCAVVVMLATTALAEPAHRIISLAPSVTETIFALGAGDQLVGVSVYCDYPPEVAKLERVGTFLTPNVEAIVAKRPDLVIAVPSPGNRAPVESLRQLGIEVMVVEPNSVADIEASIVAVADAIGRAEAGRALVARIEERIRGLRARLDGAPQRKVLMVVGQTPLIAVGAPTVQDELIRLAHGINLGARAGGAWPHISLEYAIAEAPEVIIDTTMGNEEQAGARGTMAFWQAFPTLPAVRNGNVHGFREYQLLRPGPRIAEAFETFARFIQPERMQ